jgi:hypothetical protein
MVPPIEVTSGSDDGQECRAAFGCGAARRPSGEHSQFRSFDDGRHPDGVSTGAWPVREVSTAWW